MKKILIINGPNLNLLGRREPDVYGNTSFEAYLDQIRADFPQYEITSYQSNIEGELINKIHEAGFSSDGIVLNAGAYTHTSIALHDAIRAVTLLTRVIADAVADGVLTRSGGKAKAGDNAEPMPEWEAELLAGETATKEDETPEAEQA